MKIDHLDHLVLTVQNVEATCDFYSTKTKMNYLTPEKTISA